MNAREEARDYAADVTLLDGTPARIRAVHADDKHHLVDGMSQLSQRSTRLRFFTPKKKLSERELQYFTELDFVRHVALGAMIDGASGESAIGIGRYVVDEQSPIRAEVAFTVLDSHQGRGVATLLLHHLAHLARAAGIDEFTALVLAENRDMLEVFEHSGYPQKHTIDGEEIRVVMDIRDGREPGAGSREHH